MYSDVAQTDKNKDLLNRVTFAAEIARGLEYSFRSNEESIVLGLNGSWGSGKSSLVHFIVDETKILADVNDLLVVHIPFNPWMFSSQSELLYLFYSQLQQEFSKKKEQLKRVAGRFDSVANNLDSIIKVIGTLITSMSPSVGIFAVAFSKMLKAFTADTKLPTLKKEIDRLIIKAGVKLIITIDDIDRLNPNEIKEIFKLVKLNANFKNTVFILAYDRDVVIESLQNEFKINASRYLEKIVQVDYTVPNPTGHQLQEILVSRLRESFISTSSHNDDVLKSEVENALHYIPSEQFNWYITNIRDINRFVNSLLLRIPSIYKQVNLLDFFTIEAVRIFDTPLYQFILKHKADLIHITSSPISELRMISYSSQQKHKEERLEPSDFIEASNLNSKQKAILNRLFVVDKPQSTFVPSFDDADLIQNARIASYNYFNRYFSLQLSYNEIDEGHFGIMLADNEVGEKISVLQYLSKDNNINLFTKLMLIKHNTPAEIIEKKILSAYLQFSKDLRDELQVDRLSLNNLSYRIRDISSLTSKNADNLSSREIIVDFLNDEESFIKPPIFKFNLAESIMAAHHRFSGNYNGIDEHFKNLLFVKYKLNCEDFINRIKAVIMFYCKSYFFVNLENVKSLNESESQSLNHYLAMYHREYLTTALEPFFSDNEFLLDYIGQIIKIGIMATGDGIAYTIGPGSNYTNHSFEFFNVLVDKVDKSTLTIDQLSIYDFYQAHRKHGFTGKKYLRIGDLELLHERD